MRKSIALDIGFMPREWATKELTSGGTITIGKRIPSWIGINVTWISDPRFPRGLKTIAQCNYESIDEKRLLRVINKWGWKIVNFPHPLGQNGIEETDPSGKEHQVELTDEIITGNWSINQR